MIRTIFVMATAFLFAAVPAATVFFPASQAAAAPQELAGDFNDDGYRTSADVNMLTAFGDLTAGVPPVETDFDMTGNGKVEFTDLQVWLELGTVNEDPMLDNGGTIMGDANLDGIVDREDETIILESFGSEADCYTKGDVNGSGEVDGIDLLIYFRALFFNKRRGR